MEFDQMTVGSVLCKCLGLDNNKQVMYSLAESEHYVLDSWASITNTVPEVLFDIIERSLNNMAKLTKENSSTFVLELDQNIVISLNM